MVHNIEKIRAVVDAPANSTNAAFASSEPSHGGRLSSRYLPQVGIGRFDLAVEGSVAFDNFTIAEPSFSRGEESRVGAPETEQAGVSTVHFPLFGDSLGPIFKLMLRQPQELGDRAFLKAVLLPRRKALDDSPSINSKRNIEQMQYIESLL